jgi:hypothetical protein
MKIFFNSTISPTLGRETLNELKSDAREKKTSWKLNFLT